MPTLSQGRSSGRATGWAVGVEAFSGMEPNDLVLWIESRRALVVGDTLIDWANRGVPARQVLETLQPLLELPVELVLPIHRAPTD